MAISFGCPGCSTPFNVGPEMAGKKAKCPKCLMVFTVPDAGPAPPPAAVTAKVVAEEERPRPKPYEKDDYDDKDPDRKRPRSRRDDEEEDEPRPARRKARRSSGGSALPWVLGIGVAAVVL